MREKRSNGRVATKTSVEDEIVHLRGLDLKGLRARWQSVLQRPAPDHLPRHLLFAIIAYRIQADRLGDLDHETRQVLDRTDSKEAGAAMSARLVRLEAAILSRMRSEVTSLSNWLATGWRLHSVVTAERGAPLGPLCYDERWIGIAGLCNMGSIGSAGQDQGQAISCSAS